MEVQQDFRDLLELFNKHKVDYSSWGLTHWGFMVPPATRVTLTSL